MYNYSIKYPMSTVRQLKETIEQIYITPLYDTVKNGSLPVAERVSAYHQLSKIDGLTNNLNVVTDEDVNQIMENAKAIFDDKSDKSSEFDEHERELVKTLTENPNIPFDDTYEGGSRTVGKRSRRERSRTAGKRSRRERSRRERSRRERSRRKRTSKSGAKTYSTNCIVGTLTDMLHTVKLYHWRTHSYSEHKATDNLHEALSEQVDSFVEKLLGSKQTRSNLTHLRMNAYNTLPALKRRIEYYKRYLRGMPASLGTDLLNIRDELLGSLNQFSYMLSLH